MNTAYLPLGFLTEPELADLDFSAGNGTFQFQNDLFTAATGIDEEVWHKLQGENLTITGNGADITESNSTGYCKYSGCVSGANVTYSYTADRDGFVCVHLNLPKRNDFYVSVNGVELYKETISLSQMIAVGDVKTGDTMELHMSEGTAVANGKTYSCTKLPEYMQNILNQGGLIASLNREEE